MKNLKHLITVLPFLICACLMTGCQSPTPIRTVQSVDLDRFMGDWYVIACIPTFIETEAYNAVENYARGEGNRIDTTFIFNKGGFDGPRKEYKPTGFVSKESNAVWGMQFIWPFKAEYRIVYLDGDYTQTIIGRSKRDYVWIMARSPDIPDNDYQHLLKILAEEGYDLQQLRKVPTSRHRVGPHPAGLAFSS
jgi:apolipoprotein D and lipocalin family protein